MKKLLLFAAALLAVCSCDFSEIFSRYVKGNGISVDVPCTLSEFNAVSSLGSIDVFYTQTSGEQSVVLTCDENLVEYYNIAVKNGTLNVTVKSGYLVNPETKTFVTVKTPNLKSVSLTGSGDCFVNGDIKSSDDLSFSLSGSGDLECNGSIECPIFTSKTTGSGNSTIHQLISGSAVLTTTGSGDVSVNTITAESIVLVSSGSGDGYLGCKDAGGISVRITGSGSVTLTGNARSLTEKVTGSGRVNSRNLSLD